MCGSQQAEDGIVQGFGVVLSASREVVAVSAPHRVRKGAARGEAVAAYLQQQNRELVDLWAVTGPDTAVYAAIQAGAAATEALADLLNALLADDATTARAVLELFVNDAVDTGAVTL